MRRVSVNSSNLASIGYNEQNEVLEIEFNQGGVYQYYDVSTDVHDELMNSDSHGKYFIANIKGNYNLKKI
jgi:hypothetical protein